MIAIDHSRSDLAPHRGCSAGSPLAAFGRSVLRRSVATGSATIRKVYHPIGEVSFRRATADEAGDDDER